ncbi:hypothetical protein PSACC_03273 [Paramicrosporidium saccamoebae]|uniref:Ribonuclease P/MRP protein subunit POP5 n=1 Tax=Paramicrosporidium saccamoebae TaxID=1246581 RepID=A0A2H9TGT2_9FUNG|nr:hypothetical protein PSACC_03273 [Paramicrosporidium saccamoebae]
MVRFKNRYLLIEGLSVDPKHGLVDYQPTTTLSTTSLATQLRSCLGTNFGHFGSAMTAQSLSVKYVNATTGMAVVRCAREGVAMVWAAVTLMGLWRVVRVAGTIRGAQKAAMKIAVTRLKGLQRKLSGDKGKTEEFDELIRKCRDAIKLIEA